ncbi:MAG: hypothetical protein P8M61_08435 [Crocinitomicaceae bacterium]|jgi:hypothetical protein|nr:hypothetical protein [Crocinitomicaceae bacterium]
MNVRLIVLLFLFTFMANEGSTQTLRKSIKSIKRKYYGTYEGQINGYKFDAGDKLVEVNPIPIQIEINVGYLTIQIGKLTTRGDFEVLFEADDYYVLDATMENQSVGERIVVYKKGKKISRDGLYPQPSALLFLN